MHDIFLQLSVARILPNRHNTKMAKKKNIHFNYKTQSRLVCELSRVESVPHPTASHYRRLGLNYHLARMKLQFSHESTEFTTSKSLTTSLIIPRWRGKQRPFRVKRVSFYNEQSYVPRDAVHKCVPVENLLRDTDSGILASRISYPSRRYNRTHPGAWA